MRYYRPNKYGNTKVEGFDSKLEYSRYNQLCLLERANEICKLETQKSFVLLESQIDQYTGELLRGISYKADFFYYDNSKNRFVVEDTKGFQTDVFRIKHKLFVNRYPEIEFILVRKGSKFDF